MDFTEQEMNEFRSEAVEMLDAAERDLLAIDSGEPHSTHYDAIFRVFHSLKGGAGMLGMGALQAHMHSLEGIFSGFKESPEIPKETLSLLLRAVDASRLLLDGKDASFVFTATDEANAPALSSRQEKPAFVPPITALTALDSKAQVYVIDDEKDVLDVIEFELKSDNMECKTFTDFETLMDAIKKSPPDVVLTDMKMPTHSGMDILRAIQKIDPDLPVIFVSGFLDKDTLMESLDYGVYAALEKPFNEKTLLTYVRNGVKQRRAAKFFNRSINLILYQFSDLDSILVEHGKDDIRKTIRYELNELLLFRRKLRKLKKDEKKELESV